AVIAVLSLFIWPWAAQMGGQYQSRVRSRDDVSRVSPGVFGETGSKERVFFVESVSGDSSSVQNVFVASVQQARMGVSMSRTGHTEAAANGDRFLVLEQGRRYEGSAGDDEYRVTEFDRYAARIETKESSEPEMTPRNRSTWTLLTQPTSQNLGELVWRVGVPLSALVLVLLAIPMSFVNPRAGRSVNLLFALFTYIVYSNLLSVSQARVYELLPGGVLSGTLYVLAHLASNSEYAVMRGSGLSPARAGLVLTRIGLAFVLATFVIGEWIAPFAEEEAQKLRLRAMSSLIGDTLQSGLWFKDEGSFINVREARRADVLQGVRIYEFDSAYRLRQMTAAQRAEFRGRGRWELTDVVQTRFAPEGPRSERMPKSEWRSAVNPDLL